MWGILCNFCLSYKEKLIRCDKCLNDVVVELINKCDWLDGNGDNRKLITLQRIGF